MDPYKRMTLPKGLLAGTAVALAFTWGLFAIRPGSGASLISPAVQSVVYLALLAVTARSPRLKVLIVRTFQRWTINPLMRLLLAIGVNPLGLAILETRGRVSGRLRRTPVGNGRMGDSLWIIAEHGMRANYVRNIQHDPRVRVRLRQGLRYRWVPGIATVMADDDVLARQRLIIRWHPLRAFNAMNVRVLGAELLTVHVRLLEDHQRGRRTAIPRRRASASSGDRRPQTAKAAAPERAIAAATAQATARTGTRRLGLPMVVAAISRSRGRYRTRCQLPGGVDDPRRRRAKRIRHQCPTRSRRPMTAGCHLRRPPLTRRRTTTPAAR